MKANVICDIYALDIGIHIFCYIISCWRTTDMRWPIYVNITVAGALGHWQPQNWLDWDNMVSWIISINVFWHENASCITTSLWGKPMLTGGSSHEGPMMQSFWFSVGSRKRRLNEQSSSMSFQAAWLSSYVLNIICDLCLEYTYLHIICDIFI